MFFSKEGEFSPIPEQGNVGSGFIAQDLLESLLSHTVSARKAIAIQVRLVIPAVGISRGMLCHKAIRSGPPIQLPPSMRNVPASTNLQLAKEAFVLIDRNGIHPSKPNTYIGRLLDPESKPPPKSFAPRPLSDMVVRLWRGLNVQKDICADYERKIMRLRDLSHAWVVGLADPTAKLPPGHTFVTGFKTAPKESSSLGPLYLTR